LVDVTDIAGDYPNTAFVTSRSYLKSKPEAVKKFLMAMSTAIAEYKKNSEQAIKITKEFLDVKDEANARGAYEAYVKGYPDVPRPSMKGIGLVLEELGKKEEKAKTAKPEQLVDSKPLDELEGEGFFAKLAPRS